MATTDHRGQHLYDDEHLSRCGTGTQWGCGRVVRYPAHILLKGRTPMTYPGISGKDDGHVLFHAACSPAVVEPAAVRRWRGSYTGRREAE